MERKSTFIRLASLLAAIAIVAPSGCRRSSVVKSGDEVFAVLEDSVLAVSLRGATIHVQAFRERTSDAFRYRFARATRRSECASSPALDAALGETFSIRALKVYEHTEVERLAALPKEQQTVLEVTSTGKPPEPFVLSLAAKDGVVTGSSVDAYLAEHKVGFTVDSSLLHLLSLSCDTR